MKCPIYTIFNSAAEMFGTLLQVVSPKTVVVHAGPTANDCRGEDCAWYNVEAKRCGVKHA